MHSVPHTDEQVQRPRPDPLVNAFQVPRGLRIRLKTIAAKQDRSIRDLGIEVLERYATQTERELGLPQQTQGAA